MKALITETSEVLTFQHDYHSKLRDIDGADLILQIIDSPRDELSDPKGHHEVLVKLDSVAEFNEWEKIFQKFSALDDLLLTLTKEQLDTFAKYSNNGLKADDLDVDLQSIEHDIKLAHTLLEGKFVPPEEN